MKDSRKTEIRVGLTVVFALALLIFILGWAKNFSFNSDDKILSVKFNNIAGLASGDVVMVNGVKSGYVEEIKASANHVIVKLNIEPGTDLRVDARFSIMMLDLMGGKKIEISPGIIENKIDYSILQNGFFSGDISTAMAMLSSVQTDLVDVIKEVKVSLININQTIADDKFNEDLKSSVANLNTLTKNINKLINQNHLGLTSLIESSNELVTNSNNILENNSALIDSTLINISGVVNQSGKLMSKLNNLLAEIENRENNIGDILYDKELVSNIKSSMQHVKELTKILIEQLQGDGLNVDAF